MWDIQLSIGNNATRVQDIIYFNVLRSFCEVKVGHGRSLPCHHGFRYQPPTQHQNRNIEYDGRDIGSPYKVLFIITMSSISHLTESAHLACIIVFHLIDDPSYLWFLPR